MAQTTRYDSIHQLLTYLTSLDYGVDIVEVCGGEARTSSLAVRRHLKAGENFDLVTGVDLNDEIQQAAVERYFRQQRPLVVIMAPTCRPFGRWATFNYARNYDTWLRSYNDAAPHGRFCGYLAMLQIEIGGFYS